MYREQALASYYMVKEAEKVNIYEPGYARKATLRGVRAMSGGTAIDTLLKANRRIRNQRSLKKQASDDSFISKVKAGYTAARDYSPEEIRQLGTRGYIVRHPKGPTNTDRPNERIITHRGKRYAYDHREYTHGTGKRLGIGLGVLGAGATMLGPAPGISRALGVGALSGGLGYVVGRKMMSDMGEGGVKGLIDQRHRAGSAADLKRIKLRKIS